MTTQDEPRDALARWWWPGQWLRIVYGVLIDQVWYWQNVRPRLRSRVEGWGLLVQAILGTMLVVFIAILWLTLLTGVELVNGKSVAMLISIGILSIILALLVGVIFLLIGKTSLGISAVVSVVIPWMIACIVALPAAIWRIPFEFLTMGLLGWFVSGIVFGLITGAW